MDNFFDSCVIIAQALHSRNINNKTNLKCYNFINNKKSENIICHFVIKELERFRSSRRIINYEVISKAKNPEYEIGSSDISKNLSKNEVNKAKQLYELLKKYPLNKISKKLIHEIINLEIGIDKFLKFKVDKKTVPIENIEKGILSAIYDLIDNYNDCKILASAIQEQQKRPIFSFVTIDKEHFNPNTYSFVKKDPRIKDNKFPELKNLLFEN